MRIYSRDRNPFSYTFYLILSSILSFNCCDLIYSLNTSVKILIQIFFFVWIIPPNQILKINFVRGVFSKFRHKTPDEILITTKVCRLDYLGIHNYTPSINIADARCRFIFTPSTFYTGSITFYETSQTKQFVNIIAPAIWGMSLCVLQVDEILLFK